MAFDKSFRNWQVFFCCANAILLVFMGFCFPSAGFNLEDAHVRSVVDCAISTGLCLLVVILGLSSRRLLHLSLWAAEALQGYRLIPAGEALRSWPGGDDGPGLAWLMIIRPLMWTLFVVGFFVCCRTFLSSQTRAARE